MRIRSGRPPRLALGLALVAAPLSAQGASPAPPPIRDPVPVHATFTIDSRAVGERRVINVHLPPDYDARRGVSFPVVYMPDGGMEEDFPHVANTLDSLLARRAIAPVILVGVENTERRRDMTGPTTVHSDSAIAPHVGGSAAFRRFLRDELIPEIRARYRATDETTIVGESLAGLFIVETFLLEPGLFRRYLALSPSLWWNDDALLRVAAGRLMELGGAPRALFLAAATEPGIQAETAALADLLRAHAPGSLRWFYEPRPDLEHSNIYRKAGPAALAKLLNVDVRP